MARVAVVFAPLRVSRDFIDYPYFADLGALQAAAVLRAGGHDVTVSDALCLEGATLEPLDDGYVRLGVAPSELLLPEVDVTLVAYTPFHRPPHRDPLLTEVLARSRGPVALADFYQSGQHYVDAPHADILAAYPEARGYLRYEAEDELPGFVARLSAGERGLFVDGGEVRRISELPPPAWDLVDIEHRFAFHERVAEQLGRGAWAFPITGRSLPMVSSRGCPFRCVHCSSNPGRPRGAPKTQRRLDEAALERQVALLSRLGARRVHVLDELANVSERHFDLLLALLRRHDLSFEIPNGLRADYVRDHHLARVVGRMTTLSVSAESGSPRVLAEVVQKELEMADIERVAEGAAREALPLLVHFMIGLPGETRAEMNETLSYAAHLADDFGAQPSVQHATPLPGTRLAAAAGRTPLPVVDDWGPRFQGAPSLASEHASLDELRALRGAFDRRMSWPRTLVLTPTARPTRAVDEAPSLLVGALRRGRERGLERLELSGGSEGEPTLHPRLDAIVSEARRLGYREVVLVTDGRDPGAAPRLARLGLSQLVVTLSGAGAATHDARVGQAGAHAAAWATIGRATATERLVVTVRTELLEEGLAELDALVEVVRLAGARHELVVPADRRARVDDRTLECVVRASRARVDLTLVGILPCALPAELRERVVDVDGVGRRVLASSIVREPSSSRVRREPCRACVVASACGGFFEERRA